MSIPTIESFDIFNQDVVATGIQGQVQNQNQIQNQNQVQNYSLVPFSSDQDFFRNLIHSYDLDIQNLEQSVINLQNVNLRDILNEKIILKKNELNSLKEKYRQIFNQDYNY
jgi:hypothetical protein